MSDTENPPRPPRSLRDRAGARSISNNPDLLPTDYIKNDEIVVKPEDFDDGAQSYLSELEDQIVEEPVQEVIVVPEEKPKVQVLNVREKRISTGELNKQAKQQIKQEVEKAKEEFHKVEEVVDEAKEELSKLSSKISKDAADIKNKITELSLKTLETFLNSAKDILVGLFFKKPVKKKEVSKTTEKKQKSIPKVKYSNLLAKKIEFLTYDKKSLYGSGDSGAVLEEIFMANTISDVRYCIKFVAELPTPTQGIYANRKITEIFENITPEDINRFLYYVQNNPEPFVGSNYKFSEAFATWIIRKSHE